MKIKIVAALCAAGLLLASCRKDEAILKPFDGNHAAGASGNNRANMEIAFPGKTGIPKERTINGVTIHYCEIEGKVVIGGDIVMDEEHLEMLAGRIDPQRGCIRNNSAYFWTNATVYYTIDANFPNLARVINAINYWNDNTSIKMVQRTNQPNYVTFQSVSGNVSYSTFVGMQTGQQFVGVGTEATMGNVIHEIGHVIGLYHEQTRSDRDQACIINWGNITPGYENNFKTYVQLGMDGYDSQPFDFTSIMMYGSDYFSANGQPTITTLNGSTFTVQRSYLSDSDILTENLKYPTPTEELYIVSNGKLFGADAFSNARENVGPPAWTNTNTIATLNGYIYMVDGTRLYRVHKNTGVRTIIGNPVWANTEAMIAYNGWLYIVENSRLYKVDPVTGVYSQIGPAVWTGTLGMCESGGFFYILENSRLYKVDPVTGVYSQLGGAVWAGAEGIASGFAAGYIHIVQNSRLYKVNLTNGTYVQLGNAVWTGTQGMTCYNGTIHIVENSRLYRVDGNTGSYLQIGDPVWGNTAAMAGM